MNDVQAEMAKHDVISDEIDYFYHCGRDCQQSLSPSMTASRW